MNTQWNDLYNRWQNNHLPHALLLTGYKRLGKQSFAFAFAKFLLCSQKTEVACNNCRNCLLMQAASHPDFYFLHPEEQGKAIRIDQIRELIEQLNQTAQQNGYKVAVIKPADKLNQAAANALLKTLEEPSEKTIIFLIAEQASLLSATIRSRCQSIKFLPPKNFSLLTPEQQEVSQQLFKDLQLIAKQQEDPIKTATKWAKTEIKDIINYLMIGVMDLIKTKNVSTIMFGYLDKLYLVKKQILSSNLNQQLLLEDLFFEWKNLYVS